MLITLHIFVSVNYKYTILSTEVVRFEIRTPLLSQTESVLHVPYSSEYRRRVPNSLLDWFVSVCQSGVESRTYGLLWGFCKKVENAISATRICAQKWKWQLCIRLTLMMTTVMRNPHFRCMHIKVRKSLYFEF